MRYVVRWKQNVVQENVGSLRPVITAPQRKPAAPALGQRRRADCVWRCLIQLNGRNTAANFGNRVRVAQPGPRNAEDIADD